MSGPLRSTVPFAAEGSPDGAALRGAIVSASSEGLGWDGMHVEIGRNREWEARDLVVHGHYLCLNLAERPLAFESRLEGRFRRVVLEPGELWTCPAGEPFTHLVREECRYGALTFAPEKLARLAGVERLDLSHAYGVRDPRLEHLCRALLAEVERGGEEGPALAETIGSAIAVLLARRAPSAARLAAPSRGGIAPRRLRRVLDLVDARLGERLRLEELAAAAGLSPFHFAREFRRSTGLAPHRYLVARRLERARELLASSGASIGEIAAALGFADQSHLTRLFRRRYGTTPGEVKGRAR